MRCPTRSRCRSTCSAHSRATGQRQDCEALERPKFKFRKRRKTVEIGHRGSGVSYTKLSAVRENTIYSLNNAVSRGADYCEFDVMLTSGKRAKAAKAANRPSSFLQTKKVRRVFSRRPSRRHAPRFSDYFSRFYRFDRRCKAAGGGRRVNADAPRAKRRQAVDDRRDRRCANRRPHARRSRAAK